jgi:hypothetical protein
MFQSKINAHNIGMIAAKTGISLTPGQEQISHTVTLQCTYVRLDGQS